MTDYLPGGRRRLDRVLDPEFLAGVAQLTRAQLRAKLTLAEQEEADLAAIVTMLHQRLDLITAEQQHRRSGGPAITSAFPHRKRGPGRFLAESLGLARRTISPPTEPHWARRRVERLLHDVTLTDVANRTDDELERVSHTFADEETRVNHVYERVTAVVQNCQAELARRKTGKLLPRPRVGEG